MADDSDNSKEREESRDTSTYVRKKNVISGIDNDHLILAGIAGLGALISAPYIKQLLDNFLRNIPQQQQQYAQQQQQQLPPNGGGQPELHQVPNPPVTQREKLVSPVSPDVMNPLEEHERRLEEQRNYQAAMEQGNQEAGGHSIPMVPDRSKKKQKDDNAYVAGSNVSAGY